MPHAQIMFNSSSKISVTKATVATGTAASVFVCGYWSESPAMSNCHCNHIDVQLLSSSKLARMYDVHARLSVRRRCYHQHDR